MKDCSSEFHIKIAFAQLIKKVIVMCWEQKWINPLGLDKPVQLIWEFESLILIRQFESFNCCSLILNYWWVWLTFSGEFKPFKPKNVILQILSDYQSDKVRFIVELNGEKQVPRHFKSENLIKIQFLFPIQGLLRQQHRSRQWMSLHFQAVNGYAASSSCVGVLS